MKLSIIIIIILHLLLIFYTAVINQIVGTAFL